jgi:very-short-patch-repair endonuclease
MPEYSQQELTIITRNITPTKEALALKDALENRGIKVYKELHDGFKTIDLALPQAKINIEVDGIQHLTDPKQILADLGRGYYSHKNGYDTMHIPNEMIHAHLPEISDALAEAAKVRQKRIYVHVD